MTAATDKASPELAIECVDLTKVYRPRRSLAGAPPPALDRVSLAVPKGAIFGLLGPNGAGKSTLINILAGLVVKTGGAARVFGHDIEREMRAARRALGVVPQEINIDAYFTPREILETQAGLFGVPRRRRRTDELLAALHLADKADSWARALSGGMRRRLLIAKALVHDPAVLILDEPTAGVDVALRHELWRYVRSLNAGGTTILLTTHYLDEAEELCERIAILDRGRIVALDRTGALLRHFDSKSLIIVLDADLATVPAPLAREGAVLRGARELVIRYRPSAARVGEILGLARAAGLGIVDVATEEADLEQIFLHLTRGPDAPGA